ncbi:protein NETWORKED 4A-like [Silene latifolia]|uniref:protein NETWORKED 4A-like n=1 Tax=Silene latifolia TaxID=37657 RepID=UPI003D775674
MASSSVHTKKSLKGLDSRKSNSWWWDSHIGPRNIKWLSENLDDMDQNYKRMLTLIDGDGDSFAKKAEMYYQRRPELLSHVEEFYRTYKLLAERYEHLTGDMRKHLLPELHSQGSSGFDLGSETAAVAWTPQDPKIGRRGIGHRAAGFDFFLGYGRSGPDRSARGDETSSISDSETESDISSLHSYPGMIVNAGEEGTQTRLTEPEIESCSEEKFQNQGQEYNKIGSFRRSSSENFDDVHSRIAVYEEELKMAKEKIFESEEEIANLKTELQKCKSLEHVGNLPLEFPALRDSSSLDAENEDALDESSNTLDLDVSGPEDKIQALVKELRNTRARFQVVDKELMKLRKENGESTESIRKMQDLLKMAQKDSATWKRMLETEKRLASKLQERIARYKTSLSDREKEVRELKEELSDANRKYQLHAEISRLSDEKIGLEERLREWEVHCRSLETQHGMLETKLNDEIEQQKADIADKTARLESLESDFDAYKLKYASLLTEKEEVESKVREKEDQIIQMQHTIAENEVFRKKAEEVSMRVEELREEVEGQKDLIMEAAEGKREAIRQLCYSLEHYRNGYQQLRQAFTEHKQLHVCAS